MVLLRSNQLLTYYTHYRSQKKEPGFESGPVPGEADAPLVFFWRECVRIELTRDTHVPHTGFEDREAHQRQSTPVTACKATKLYHSRILPVNRRTDRTDPGKTLWKKGSRRALFHHSITISNSEPTAFDVAFRPFDFASFSTFVF